ncbi:transporter [Lithospermum erythrorhizon]|uniref:Transporter n=1 Tax=Lithospermum erythrorhizon TaxID=34254 RepID=A0AAV3P7G7_LITER
MMMPSLTASSSSSSSSSGSATVRVEKATSEFLIGPDWTLNMDICDAINSNQQLAKDVVKALKKRLQHKNPKVQLLALTLMETMVKNCGDYVHFQIADRDILQEMIKIVKRKADMHVRDKILVLLDSWQEAFGGPGGKYPQYYWAYDELRRYGVGFPQRSHDSAPIFTPPVTHPTSRTPQPGYGMPINASPSLDEAMAAEVESLSLSGLQSIRDVGDLLSDMLQAVDPTDSLAVKDEVIVDIVERCRANQKRLMQMLTTTVDEELLAQGLDLNDILQIVLAKHDAIASGSPLPDPMRRGDSQSINEQSPIPQPDNVVSTSSPMPTPSAPVAENKGPDAADEDEEDDFAQLARRHSRAQPSGASSGVGEAGPALSSALVLADPPAPVRTTKEQDMIDFLSLTLSTDSLSPRTPQTSAPSAQNMNQEPVSSTETGSAYNSQAYLGNQVPVMDSYVAPWARTQTGAPLQSQSQQQPYAQNAFQPQSQPQYQSQLQADFQIHQQFQSRPQPELQSQFQPQPQSLAHGQVQHQNQQLVQYSGQPQHQAHHQYPHNASAYPPPPWAPTPGYYSNPSTTYRSNAPSNSHNTSTPVDSMGQMQNQSPFPGSESNRLTLNGNVQVSSGPRTSAPASGQKQFIPSYRLFEDLNVLGNTDGKQKVANANQSSYRLYGARSEN